MLFLCSRTNDSERGIEYAFDDVALAVSMTTTMVIFAAKFIVPVCPVWIPGRGNPCAPATPSASPKTGVSFLRPHAHDLRYVCCAEHNAAVGHRVVPADRVGFRSSHVLLIPPTVHR